MPRYLKVAAAQMGPLQILAKAATRGDELVSARIDFEQMTPLRRRWNFLGRRQPQHSGELLRPVTEKEPYR